MYIVSNTYTYRRTRSFTPIEYPAKLLRMMHYVNNNYFYWRHSHLRFP